MKIIWAFDRPNPIMPPLNPIIWTLTLKYLSLLPHLFCLTFFSCHVEDWCVMHIYEAIYANCVEMYSVFIAPITVVTLSLKKVTWAMVLALPMGKLVKDSPPINIRFRSNHTGSKSWNLIFIRGGHLAITHKHGTLVKSW